MNNKDMFQPDYYLAVGIIGILLSVVFYIWDRFSSVEGIILIIIFFASGVFIVLEWKNHWIRMVDQKRFIYSTILGKQKSFSFAEVQNIKRNISSVTLIFPDGKVTIGAGSEVSSKFVKRVDFFLGKKLEQYKPLKTLLDEMKDIKWYRYYQ